MEVLHYEIVNIGIDLFTTVLLSLMSLLAGFCLYKANLKLLSVSMTLILIVFVVSSYILTNQEYEYQKVIVSDWNIVHNEGWEVIKQEGEIVELKRKLKEE